MSGLKPVALTEFYRKLHARGMTTHKLARRIMGGRAHLSQVLNGSRPGSQTWAKLARVLKQDELALLGRDAKGRPLADVPRGALSHVGQFLTERKDPQS